MLWPLTSSTSSSSSTPTPIISDYRNFGLNNNPPTVWRGLANALPRDRRNAFQPIIDQICQQAATTAVNYRLIRQLHSHTLTRSKEQKVCTTKVLRADCIQSISKSRIVISPFHYQPYSRGKQHTTLQKADSQEIATISVALAYVPNCSLYLSTRILPRIL